MSDSTPFVINDEDDWSDTEDELTDFNDEVAEIDRAEWLQIQQVISTRPVPSGHVCVDQVEAFGLTIKAGMGFELRHPAEKGEKYRDFIRVQYVTKKRNAPCDSPDAILLHALRLRRARDVDLKRNAGELCMLITVDIDDNDTRTDVQRGLAAYGLTEIIPASRNIIFTNRPFPAFRDGPRMHGDDSNRYWEEGTLVCRWKRRQYFKRPRTETAIRRAWLEISEGEADEGYSMPAAQKILDFLMDHLKAKEEQEKRQDQQTSLRSRLASLAIQPTSGGSKRGQRGDTGLPSAYKGVSIATLGIQLDRDFAYSFGDHFCGFGGVSRAAQKAGLTIVFGNDLAPWATATYRLNFPRARTFQKHCGDFCIESTFTGVGYCHIIHFSPPCPPFSPSHTVPGSNDEANRDALLSIGALLKAHRPRFVTLEQTSGLMTHSEHKKYFAVLQRLFTDELGYNLQLQITNLAEHDSPSQRKRLIIMACCPGETLPPFPPPSRGVKHGLPPFMTLREALARISVNDPWHTPEEMFEAHRLRPKNKPPAKWDEPMRRILTCGGPDFLHPHGRSFTLRELMRIMRLPDTHQLPPGIPLTHALRGLGNALPPDCMTKIYTAFVAQLKESDDKIKAFLAPIEIDIESEEGGGGGGARSSASSSTLRSSTTPPSAREWRSGRGAQDAIELSDGEDDVQLITTPSRRSGGPAMKRQRIANEVLTAKNETARDHVAASTEADPFLEVMDLTED